MVPSWADQLLPQLLMEQFDTMSIQCRHIEICMKEFGSEKNIFDKMTEFGSEKIIFDKMTAVRI